MTVTQHRWMALGSSPMTSEQAKEWAGLTGLGIAHASLEVMFSSMTCAVCLEEWGEALPECPGLPKGDENEHVWQAFFTAPATEEDAAAWADPDGDYRPGLPHSIAVQCVLCGTSPDDASDECNERSFWTKESSLDIEVDDFTHSFNSSGALAGDAMTLSGEGASRQAPLGPRFRDALTYAAELHQFQVRKGGEIPYVGHLLIVAGTVIEWGGTEDQAIAAVLHDAVEDQPEQTPEVEMRRRFGDYVAEMVLGLSDTDVIPKPPWLSRKQAYFERLANEPLDVVLISAADKLHNARAILSDFVDQGESLWRRFSVNDQGALPQVWYFSKLLEVYERRLEPKHTWELRSTVEELASRAGLSLDDLPTPIQT